MLVSINMLNRRFAASNFLFHLIASIVTLICTTAVKCHPATSASSKNRSIQFPFKTDTTAQPPRAELLYCRCCDILKASGSNLYCGSKKSAKWVERCRDISSTPLSIMLLYLFLTARCEQHSWVYLLSSCRGSLNHKRLLWYCEKAKFISLTES